MQKPGMGNSLKSDSGMIDLSINDAAKLHDLKMVEKEDDEHWIGKN